jgi:hypothetical protein
LAVRRPEIEPAGHQEIDGLGSLTRGDFSPRQLLPQRVRRLGEQEIRREQTVGPATG